MKNYLDSSLNTGSSATRAQRNSPCENIENSETTTGKHRGT